MKIIYFIINCLSNKFLYPVWRLLYKASLALMNFWFTWPWEDRFLKRLSKNKRWTEKKLVFFDVGGNVWDYIKSIIEIFGEKKVEVFSFEPSPVTFAALKKNTSHYKNVKIFNIWLWEKEQVMKLFTDFDLSGSASLHKDVFGFWDNKLASQTEVQIKSLDDFCKHEWVDTIDFMKVDIEWNEFNALLWASSLIKWGKIGIIQFEFNRCNIASKVFFKDFYDLLWDTYDFYRILPNWLYKIKEYNYLYLEIFIYSNYVAINKWLRGVVTHI